MKGNVFSEDEVDNHSKFLSDDEFDSLWHAMKNHTKVWMLVSLSEDEQGKLCKSGHLIYSVSESECKANFPEITGD